MVQTILVDGPLRRGQIRSTEIGSDLYRAGETRDLTSLPSGATYGDPYDDTHTNPDNDVRWSFYRQPNSIIIGNMDQGAGNGYWFIRDIVGDRTTNAQLEALPDTGSYTYTGKTLWHDLNREGDFSYTVNLATRKGSGTISNMQGSSGIFAWTGSGTLDSADIALQTGGWVGVKNGTGSMTTNNPLINFQWAIADVDPTYDLALFGDNAEEVAGVVKLSEDIGSFGIAGAR